MMIAMSKIPIAMSIPVIGMVVGLIKKSREYQNVDLKDHSDVAAEETAVSTEEKTGVTPTDKILHFFTLIAIVVAFVLQLTFGSMVIGAIGGITVMFLSRVVYLKAGDKVVQEGMLMMGAIAFIMLIASGFANVLTETDSINEFVSSASDWFEGSSHLFSAFMLSVNRTIYHYGYWSIFWNSTNNCCSVCTVMCCSGIWYISNCCSDWNRRGTWGRGIPCFR
ncbi:Na+/H+ antiporter NhaC family protein [Pseudalkalibacillus sp. A8]|uniref:Na+/H+ antiporter NhaC family protein n=1 Tax=Pseudalkalibacillus sp. A8 TaxID=3382641 RepID=UPI0038B4E60C